MRKTGRIILLSAIIFFSCVSRGADDTTSKIKAVFVYNFTKYIEWPSAYKTGNFVIGILGSSNIFNELNNMAATKKAGSQTFEIKPFSNAAAISKCHILFVSQDYAASMKDVLAKIKGNSTLVVTEKPGLAKQGAAINFVVQDNKQKFELNKANAEKYDLKVSSNLESLAIKVD
jgi:hypothetical protein